MIAAAMQPPPAPGEQPGQNTLARAPDTAINLGVADGSLKGTGIYGWRRRRLGRAVASGAASLAAVLVVAGAVLTGVAGARTASASSAVMPVGSIVELSSRPAPLAAPADGRVNGYGFAGRVAGVADGPVLPSGRSAAAGATLWVFALSWQAHQSAAGTVTDPSAVIAGGGTSILVPLSQPFSSPGDPSVASVASGTEYFAASLPSGSADVVLSMSSGGFSQEFSLTHMTREGSQPAVLYRDPAGWRIKSDVGVQRVLATPYDDGTLSLPKAALIVDMADVTLSYFGPGGPSGTPADPGMAWLVPSLSDPPQPVSDVTRDVQYDSPVTAADMTLNVAGQVLHPHVFPGGADPPLTAAGSVGSDLQSHVFVYRYGFEVPATVTAATLQITVPPGPAVAAFSADTPITVNPGTATIPITFPTAAVFVAQPGAATSPLHFATPTAAGAPGASGSSGRPAGSASPAASTPGSLLDATNVIEILLAAVVVAGLVALRVRRRPAKPTGPQMPSSAATAGYGGQPLPGYPPGFYYPPGSHPGEPDDAEPSQRQTVPDGPDTHSGLDSGLDSALEGGLNSALEGGLEGGLEDLSGVADAGPADLIGPVGVSTRFVAPVPPELPGVSVRVLGRVEVSGWVEQPSRAVLAEILVYLACHRERPSSLDRIAWALGAGSESDPGGVTVRSNLSRLRKAIGAERLPDGRAGYQLQGVCCDWDVMQDHAKVGRAALEDGDVGSAVVSLGEAAALICGPPFDVDSGYGWVDNEGLRTHLEVFCATLTIQLAGLALRAGDTDLALWAAHKGALVDPLNDDLAAVALDAAAAGGSGGALRGEWTRIVRHHNARGVQPTAELVERWKHHTANR